MEQRDSSDLLLGSTLKFSDNYRDTTFCDDLAYYSGATSSCNATDINELPTDEVAQLKNEISFLKKSIKNLENKHAQYILEQNTYTQRFERLLRQLPCGVIMLDGNGLIEHINDYAIRLFNQIQVGESWLKVIQREFAPREDDGHEISLRNGRRVRLDTASLDDASGQIVILLDLTETRNLQSQLSHQQRLVEMGKMMASLAHQIRTPLSTAMLYSSHLNSSQLDREQAQKYAHKLQNRLACINQQINDMLIYVRGGVELDEWVDVSSLFEEVKIYCKETARPDGSTLKINPVKNLMFVRCNKVALVGALSNLIQNAFQSQESEVNVVLSATVENDQKVTIRVNDNGPGIQPENYEQIFTPFYTTKSVGTGLGLPIVQKVMEAHGGEISIDKSFMNKPGCSFVITLPAVTGSVSEGEYVNE